MKGDDGNRCVRRRVHDLEIALSHFSILSLQFVLRMMPRDQPCVQINGNPSKTKHALLFRSAYSFTLDHFYVAWGAIDETLGRMKTHPHNPKNSSGSMLPSALNYEHYSHYAGSSTHCNSYSSCNRYNPHNYHSLNILHSQSSHCNFHI